MRRKTMQAVNITHLIDKIYEAVEARKIAPGVYKRFINDEGADPYGCADAANILYTIGRFPKDAEERKAFVDALRAMQDPETGMFKEIYERPNIHVHDTIHTTAHCMAAIELFDETPLYPAKALEQYVTPEKFHEFMESVDWVGAPWADSHKPAGLFVALNLGGTDCKEFNKMYFKWMWDNADPDTGLWRKGCQDGTMSLWHHMGGTFHYLFNHEWAHMPIRYPDKLIDSCIYMYGNIEGSQPYKTFKQGTSSFIQVDWVYCITRAMQQTPHRFHDAMATLEDFAETYIEAWNNKNFANVELHGLFGALCCLTELQRALRGKIYTETPLKLVLDRRPFI